MARDRKRSQGRRKKPSGGNPAKARDSKAREMGLDDSSIDESGLTDPAAAPDPLKNVSPDVDQARMAEAGAQRGESGDVDLGEDAFYDPEFEHAADEVQDDLNRQAEALPAGADPAVLEARRPRRKQRGKVLTFLGNSWQELQRVQWPNRRQVGQATTVTLGFVVIAGAWLGLMDAIWKPIVNAII